MSACGFGSYGEIERSMKSFPYVDFPSDVHIGMVEHLGYRITTSLPWRVIKLCRLHVGTDLLI